MRKVSPEMEEKMKAEVLLSISADVSFVSNQFPKYKLGSDNEILEEPMDGNDGPSLKEAVEQESVYLSEQHKRLSVRDLATKFDKNLVSAAKLTDETKIKEPASLEGHVLLKKLRDALESLRGRLAGRNKDDVEIAISMVEALAVKLTQKEGELIQEKFEVKKLINFLKQASEDAKKLVNQEKSFACAEIESARAVVQRFGEALEEEERNSLTTRNQEMEDLLEEVQEGRRIKLLHQRSKMMGMELEILALKLQIREKSIFTVNIQKELAMSKRAEVNRSSLYSLHGSEALCSCLRLQPRTDIAPQLSKCSIQWYRVSDDGSQKELISGANRSVYAPEPFDVGRVLQAEIIFNCQKFTVSTVGPIVSAAGLENYVEKLLQKSKTEFHVVISQMNGQAHTSKSIHTFHVGKIRMKICRGWITKARENYSTSMQLCGARSTIHAAAKAMFLQTRKGLTFLLTFDSERDRNAAIMLARKYALDCNINLAGPDDKVYKYIN